MDKRKYNREKIIEHIEPFNTHYKQHPVCQMIMSGQRFEHSLDYLDNLKNKKDRAIYVLKAYYPLFCRHIYQLAEIPEEGNLLSLGCGFGGDEKNLAGSYPKLNIWGLDLSRVMLEAAARNNEEHPNVRHCLAAAELLPFSDGYFDRIISREVIEHVIDPSAMMKEIKRVLAPGGICVIATPNSRFLPWTWIRKRLFKQPLNKDKVKDEHIKVSKALKIFSDSGLRVKQVFYDGGLYFQIAATPSMFAYLIPIFERVTRPLHSFPILKQLLCDQVKYVLVNAEGKDVSNSRDRNSLGLVCPYCKNRFDMSKREGLFNCQYCNEGFLYRDGYYDFIYTQDLLRKFERRKEKNSLPGKKRYLFRELSLTAWWLFKAVLYFLLILFLLPLSFYLKIRKTADH